MAPPAHLESVLERGRAAQTRRRSRSATQEGIAPDEYPTFTRPISPLLDESKRYTQDPPKRKRTNPWSFRRNSNATESGDDCDRPLSRKLSRKASTVFHIFTPQRTRSNASTGPPQNVPEQPGDPEAHVQPAGTSHHVTDERRRSSLQKFKDFIIEIIRKDSAASEKSHLPAPPLDDDDHAMGLFQRSSPKDLQPVYTADPELTHMTGALPSGTRGCTSLDPLITHNLSESKRRKVSAAAASPHSTDADHDDLCAPFSPNLTGYSPPPIPKRRATHHTSGWRYSAWPASTAKHTDMTNATPRHVVAPWETPSDTDLPSSSTSTIGILPSLSSVESANHIAHPIFALPSTTANSSTIALHTPSRPQSPAPSAMHMCPASPEIEPTVDPDGRPSILSLPSPRFALPPPTSLDEMDVAMPGAYIYSPSLPASSVGFLTVPDVDTRPSTAADSTDEDIGELRLRRAGSLRRKGGGELAALEGMEGLEGYEFVDRAVGWRVDAR